MKATCPKNPNHKRFETAVHVKQLWEVTQVGDLVRVRNPCLEVTHEPEVDNIWTCGVCGVEAKVE